ncbi:pilus assembly FimT family protein [Paraburkholderia hayleyella]|uniref:pilus assembly FimT family protein n=1 Tax=Paraburkholderia hayleyella TaxID=2152889 RepID=UPI001581254A|nr:GspH/FimT family pseudopilin [Paraburkholderia hayleyella]
MKDNAFTGPLWRGFTLVETLVVLALTMLVIMMAAPSFVVWQVRDQVDAEARKFIAALAFARAEAVHRGLPVTLCRTDSAQHCLAVGQVCGGAHDWSCGWAVVVRLAGLTHVLRAQSGESRVRVSGMLADLTFTPPAGQLIGRFRSFDFAPRFGIEATRGERFRRCIRIAAGGRARIAEGRCGAEQ